MLSATATAASAAPAPSRGYRIYISTDMEGIGGSVSAQEIGSRGSDYGRFQRIFTDEVLAAIKGAEEAGATEFVVSDSHGNQRNFLIEALPANVRLIRGGPRPLSMMQGVEEGRYDGVMFIGYHTGVANPKGVAAHTWTGDVASIKLNGVDASEGLLNAALAAQFGVPVILATGDDATVEELRATVGDMETAAVKRALGAEAADAMPPGQSQEMIRQAARRAVQRIGNFKANKPTGPAVLDLTFVSRKAADMLSWLPIVERTGANSVRYRAKDMVGIINFLEFATSYSPESKP
jgi:D-amino peptidase